MKEELNSDGQCGEKRKSSHLISSKLWMQKLEIVLCSLENSYFFCVALVV
ncbi:hypothetical protein CEXT_494941, partial [Caerostris extrusa]